MSNVLVRDAEPRDEDAWRDLWSRYVAFYEAEVAEPVTAATWSRILQRREGFVGRVCEVEGKVIGISVSIVHGCSWTLTPVCYLEDLFVAQSARGTGAGRALIQDLVVMAQNKGWARLYWHTRASNAVARRLYDRFLPADDFVKYSLAL